MPNGIYTATDGRRVTVTNTPNGYLLRYADGTVTSVS